MATASTALAVAAAVPCCPEDVHEEFKSSAQWPEAPFRGYMTGRPATELYECRLCPVCTSMLMRKIEVVKVRYVRLPRPAGLRRTLGRAAAPGAR